VTCRSALAAAVVVIAVGGCSIGDDGGGEGGPATVYVSLPLRTADGRDAADGAAMALADARGRAGGREIRAVELDDSQRVGGELRWTPARVGRNARRAIRDSTSLAYIGELESGATRVSLPITNEARMLQVSPASGADDLVVEPGTFDDVPEAQPSDERTFGRVIPSDGVQAGAAAVWGKRLGARSVAVRAGQSRFARSMAAEFTEEAERQGLSVRRPESADLLYMADVSNGGGALTGFDGEVMLSDAALASDSGSIPPDTPITSAAVDPSHLPAAGQDFAARFREEHRRAPGRYAAYGYEAMAVVLDAIERAGGDADRSEVIDAFFATPERESILGPYAITGLGETTLDRMTGYRLSDGERIPAARLLAP
jgi:branched-chain amino acid transport system substrate-binding protein